MAIPGNAITPAPIVTAFTAPADEPYTPLYQKVWGGTAIGNGVAGRRVKYWEVSYETGSIRVRPVGGAEAFSLRVAGVLACSLAFDQNMGVVLAWQTVSGSSIYFYGNTGSYTTLEVAGATSCRIAVDDLRQESTASSDVIFAYTLNNTLYWRQQRENYTIQRTVGATTRQLKKLGMNVGNRLQLLLE